MKSIIDIELHQLTGCRRLVNGLLVRTGGEVAITEGCWASRDGGGFRRGSACRGKDDAKRHHQVLLHL
jgi:hypothetical protein